MSAANGSRPVETAELLAELEAAAGADALTEASLSLLGSEVRHRVAPPDGEALGRVLDVLNERGASAVVRGGGTHDELGNALGPVAIELSTQRLSGIQEFDEGDGVVRVGAGTRVAELRAHVGEEGWDVALDTAGLSPDDTSTVGGTLAAAAFGARRLGFGPPRDCVLGLDVALPTGQRTRCGARVVKNVTGYDLQKLYCGSFGSLGVIEAAWLRLRPRPERTASLFAHVESTSDRVGATLGLATARRSTARCVAILDATSSAQAGLPAPAAGDAPPFTLLFEFAGPGAAVDDEVAWLRTRCDAQPAPAGAVDSVAGLMRRPATPNGASGGAEGEGLVARLAMLPSAVSRCVFELQSRGAGVVAHPGIGIVYASWLAPDSSGAGGLDMRGIVRDIEQIATTCRAKLRFERLPVRRRDAAGMDVFGELERGEWQLMRALKQRFDAGRVLNPGRCAGRI